jgi:predicted nucleic acid-binding protein
VRVYVDSSALLKRSVEEAESNAVEEVLGRHIDDGDPLVSSSLAWIEVSRALRSRLDGEDHDVISEAIEDALSGVAERSIAADVVSLARRIGPNVLRSLDAIHLATAILVDADALITYDERLAAAARDNDVTVVAPRPEEQDRLGPETVGPPEEEG